jgi:hypothetical protein
MEAIPLVETSAAACTKVVTFSWISRFGHPETITSDCGPQFTSNLWSQLCSMLNTTHRQQWCHMAVVTAIFQKCGRRKKLVAVENCWP